MSRDMKSDHFGGYSVVNFERRSTRKWLFMGIVSPSFRTGHRGARTATGEGKLLGTDRRLSFPPYCSRFHVRGVVSSIEFPAGSRKYSERPPLGHV